MQAWSSCHQDLSLSMSPTCEYGISQLQVLSTRVPAMFHACFPVIHSPVSAVSVNLLAPSMRLHTSQQHDGRCLVLRSILDSSASQLMYGIMCLAVMPDPTRLWTGCTNPSTTWSQIPSLLLCSPAGPPGTATKACEQMCAYRMMLMQEAPAAGRANSGIAHLHLHPSQGLGTKCSAEITTNPMLPATLLTLHNTLHPALRSLTWAQKVSMGFHFAIDQRARAITRTFPTTSNSTTGVWRLGAVREAGGWNSGTTAADMDLGVRLFAAGYTFKYLPHVKCPSELPSTMAEYRVQQYHWFAGLFQVCVCVSWVPHACPSFTQCAFTQYALNLRLPLTLLHCFLDAGHAQVVPGHVVQQQGRLCC